MSNIQNAFSTLCRYTLVLTFLALLVTCSPKEAAPDQSSLTGKIYTDVEVDQLPIPQGGTGGLSNYLIKNLRYPLEAQKTNIQGKVIVGFVVSNLGRIAEVQVRQGIGGGCDEEAVRVIKQMPDWTPGQQNGKPVNVRTSLPISFTLL
ncbi:energy transducer TonB [Spirosoma flavum]|uniref:Energy transducer TonB n=1 Tax=Spirosoma flavum TaxID=2048557 RepID=A0ABW6ATH1_9BACT